MRSSPSRRQLVAIGVILIVLLGGVYLFFVRPALFRSHQARTVSDMDFVERCLHDYNKSHGFFPTTLVEAFGEKGLLPMLEDGFGVPYLYESRGDAFILVSLGSDAEQDGIDYWELRSRGTAPELLTGQFGEDQFVSDQGWHRRGGK